MLCLFLFFGIATIITFFFVNFLPIADFTNTSHRTFVDSKPVLLNADCNYDGTLKFLPNTVSWSEFPNCTIATTTGTFSGSTKKAGEKKLTIAGYEDIVAVSATQAVGCTLNARNVWGPNTEDVSALPNGECVLITYDASDSVVDIAELPVVGFPYGIAFHPHGGAFDASTTPPRLIFVNHGYSRGGERIEGFALESNGTRMVLRHTGALLSGHKFTETFNGVANDVVVSPSGRGILVTKYLSAPDPIKGRHTEGHMSHIRKVMPIIEVVFFRSTGIFWCPLPPADGTGIAASVTAGDACTQVASGIGMANGMARGRVLETNVLIVADTTGHSMWVYEIRDDGRELLPIETKIIESSNNSVLQSYRKLMRPFPGETILPRSADNIAPLNPATPIATAEGAQGDTLRFVAGSIGNLWEAFRSQQRSGVKTFGGATELRLIFSPRVSTNFELSIPSVHETLRKILKPYDRLSGGYLSSETGGTPSVLQLELVQSRDIAMVDHTPLFTGLASAVVFGGNVIAMGAYDAEGIAVCSTKKK